MPKLSSILTPAGCLRLIQLCQKQKGFRVCFSSSYTSSDFIPVYTTPLTLPSSIKDLANHHRAGFENAACK